MRISGLAIVLVPVFLAVGSIARRNGVGFDEAVGFVAVVVVLVVDVVERCGVVGVVVAAAVVEAALPTPEANDEGNPTGAASNHHPTQRV